MPLVSALQVTPRGMRKTDKYAHAAKIIALCLPPVLMALTGLAALARKKDRHAATERKNPDAERQSGAG